LFNERLINFKELVVFPRLTCGLGIISEILSGGIYQSGGWVNIFGLLMHQHLYGFDELSFKSFSDQFAILFIDDIIVYSKSKQRDDPKYPTHDWIWQQWFFFPLKILRYHLYEKNLLDLYRSQKFMV